MKNNERGVTRIVVDNIVADFEKKVVLIQKRSVEKKLFPNCWDLIGGHLEENETVLECIKRELMEETTMELIEVMKKIHKFSWFCEGIKIKDVVYLIRARGQVRLEKDKTIEFKWIKEDEASLLLRDYETTNGLYESVIKAFCYMDNIK